MYVYDMLKTYDILMSVESWHQAEVGGFSPTDAMASENARIFSERKTGIRS